MNTKLNQIIELLKTLTLLEAAELVTEIEKIFGVDTSISVPVNALPVPTTVAAEFKEEKTSFDLVLVEVPSDKKIAILKVIRNITGLGLKESKDIVDNAPKLVKEAITKEDSENYKKELEAVGAKVSIK
jgi:large subunit ribosomal protein L7/L12